MKKSFSLFCALMLAVSAFAAGKQSFDVSGFGAKGDGLTKDTAAFQKALDAAASAGGGTVVVPEGSYVIGSITIGANTTLHLESKSCLLASGDVADYPLVNIRWEGEFRDGHRALISASSAANIAITGPGTIFGPPSPLSHLRNPRGPALIELTDCTNALLEGFTTQYQQLWSIHTLFCRKLVARGLTIRSTNANGDGIDVDSCADVLIDRCDIDTGDDAISLKSGRGLAALKLSRPTENVTIRDSRLHSSIYAALGIGTEMSGGIRNVKLENCTISGRQNAIFIKSRDGRGGYIEDITGENLVVLKSPTFVGIDLKNKGIAATDPVTGDVEKWALVKNISFKKIEVHDVAELVAGRGVPAERPCAGLQLIDISGTCAKGIALANMTDVKLTGIHVTGFDGPLISVDNVKGEGLDSAGN